MLDGNSTSDSIMRCKSSNRSSKIQTRGEGEKEKVFQLQKAQPG